MVNVSRTRGDNQEIGNKGMPKRMKRISRLERGRWRCINRDILIGFILTTQAWSQINEREKNVKLKVIPKLIEKANIPRSTLAKMRKSLDRLTSGDQALLFTATPHHYSKKSSSVIQPVRLCLEKNRSLSSQLLHQFQQIRIRIP